MPFELAPFFTGALLASWRRLDNRTLALAVIAIGIAAAALAGELSLPAPIALLAVAADTIAAAAGCVAVRAFLHVRRNAGPR